MERAEVDRSFDEDLSETMSAKRIRIEALRAAALVIHDNTNPHLDDHAANTLAIAEQFAAWLETGE